MISAIILFASISSLVIGILVLLKDSRSLSNILFASFSFLMSFWTFWNYLMTITRDPFYFRGTYAWGALVMTGILAWFYSICISYDLRKIFYIYIIGTIFSALSLTDLIIQDVSAVGESGFTGKVGLLMPLYMAYTLILIIICSVMVYRSMVKLKGGLRKKFFIIFLGTLGFGLTSLMVSFVLPLFGINFLERLDSASSLIFVFLSGYAKFKFD